MLKVLGARLAVEIEVHSKTDSGIILANEEKTNIGLVVAAGEGAHTDDGVLIPMEVKVGDKVIFAQFTGVPVDYDGKEYLIINERDILGIIEE